MNAVLAPVDQLVAIVYVSSATKHLEEDEILEILRVARRKNQELDITGMLLYRDGNFLQVLEGPAGAVESVIQKIKSDHRHKGIILMSRKHIEERQFGDWSMAFRNMSKDCSNEEAYSPFLEANFEEDEVGEESELVFRLLRRFKENMR